MNSVFSEFEVLESTVKFDGDSAAERMGCVGKLEVSMNTKTVTKKCEGVVTKSVTRGDGTGEIKYTLHMNRNVFCKAYGMETKGLKAGVYSYGRVSRHKEFLYTCKVLDEDGNVMYKAYPKCCVSSAKSTSIENGAEEVSEIEVTAAVSPDEYGQGEYEAFAEDVDAAVAENWLSNFSRSLVADVDTFPVSMTVSPALSAKVTIINAAGSNAGTCFVDETTGVVNVPPLENGVYTYIVYAEGYTPKTGTITVDGEAVTIGTITLESA